MSGQAHLCSKVPLREIFQKLHFRRCACVMSGTAWCQGGRRPCRGGSVRLDHVEGDTALCHSSPGWRLALFYLGAGQRRASVGILSHQRIGSACWTRRHVGPVRHALHGPPQFRRTPARVLLPGLTPSKHSNWGAGRRGLQLLMSARGDSAEHTGTGGFPAASVQLLRAPRVCAGG